MRHPVSLHSPYPPDGGHGRLRLPLHAAAACLIAAAAPAFAQQDLSQTPSLYLQGQWARHGTDAATAGATLPFGAWSMPLWSGELRGHWDLSLSRWSFDGIAGRSSTLVLGVVPTLRLRPDQGRAAWFGEAGMGGTLANRRYRARTEIHSFSTRFNFSTHLGLGVNLGVRRQHELLLSVEHVSNAGIKEPNPGLNFVRLRYALHF